MFPTHDQLGNHLPKVLNEMENIRCIVDCTEFRVEMSRDYAQQETHIIHTNIQTLSSV